MVIIISNFFYKGLFDNTKSTPEDSDTTRLYSNTAGNDTSTSPYARANMRLPKKRNWLDGIVQRFKGPQPLSGGTEARTIHINNQSLNEEQEFLHNGVTTGKYNLLTFLPKFLYEEFSKYANIFFLFISCIQVNLVIDIFYFFIKDI